MVGAFAVFAWASVAYACPERLKNRPEKSRLPTTRPMGGIRTSLTRDETILPNAAPMMIPMAMSRTFPCNANFLNSCSTGHLPSLCGASAPDPEAIPLQARDGAVEIRSPDEQIVGVVRAEYHQTDPGARQRRREGSHETCHGEIERPLELQAAPATGGLDAARDRRLGTDDRQLVGRARDRAERTRPGPRRNGGLGIETTDRELPGQQREAQSRRIHVPTE